MSQTPNLPEDVGDDSEQLFDWQQIRNWIGFILRSVKRHKIVAGITIVVVIALTAVAAAYLPRKYRSLSKLLADRSQTMAALGNPYRRIDFDPQSATRAAYETVMARENLIKIIKQTNLIERHKANRNPVLRLKDGVVQLIGGKWTPEIEMEAMVGTLEKKLTVDTGDGTVTITVIWDEAQVARQLVDTAQTGFLEARHISEVSAISEAISILETHLSDAETQIDQAIAEVRRVVDERRKSNAPIQRVIAPRPQPAAPSNLDGPKATPQELAQVKFMIQSKRRALADLEEFRNRRVTELNGQLAEQKVIYAANHPIIVDIEQRLASVKQESPQAQALARDIDQLEDEYKQMGGGQLKVTAEGINPGRSSDNVTQTLERLDPTLQDDPSVTVARDQLRLAVARYQDLQMRLDAAHIELDTARAAFKYRYSVVSPALTPRKPESPNVLVVVVGGIFMAVVVAFAVSFAMDLWQRRAMEAWQVEASFKLPVLAQLEL